jgi:glycosyltransferase involved in cell wall biosynthesis
LLVDAADHRSVARALQTLSDEQTRATLAAESLRRSARFGTADQAASRLVSVLARAAHRPGAGLRGLEPVSLVSSVLNERRDIDQLVSSLREQARAEDDIIVVDAGSDDGTRERLSSWEAQEPRLRVVDVPRASSLSTSRNTGTRAARHGMIACTDAGVLPDAGWLEGLRAARAEQEPPDLVVGTYRVAARPGRLFEAAFAAVAWPDPEELRRATPARRLWTRFFGLRFYPDRLDGRSMAFTRSAWESVEGFREELYNAEDEAFGRAVLAAGGRSDLTLDAVVTWFQHETPAATFQQFRGYGRGGGASGSVHLLRRDAVRMLAYAAFVAALVRGGRPTRIAASAATAGWLSFPIGRVVRRREPLAAVPLVPIAQAIKDAGKMVGAFEAVVLRRRQRLSRDSARPRRSLRPRR